MSGTGGLISDSHIEAQVFQISRLIQVMGQRMFCLFHHRNRDALVYSFRPPENFFPMLSANQSLHWV